MLPTPPREAPRRAPAPPRPPPRARRTRALARPPRARRTQPYALPAMRVLIFHGYLLHGTGSNVYNANLAAALVRLGHEVHLLCQDRAPDALPFVDAVGDWDGGSLAVRTLREPVRCTVYRPALAGLLPVYVADRYEGIEARPYPDCTDAEIAAYVEA